MYCIVLYFTDVEMISLIIFHGVFSTMFQDCDSCPGKSGDGNFETQIEGPESEECRRFYQATKARSFLYLEQVGGMRRA
jgi:hypothetical protein